MSEEQGFLCLTGDFGVEKGGEEAECGPSLSVYKFVVNPHQNEICLRVGLTHSAPSVV